MVGALEAEDSAPKGVPASIPELLEMRRAEPDGEFLVTDNERLTFGEADTASLDLADALLASGVGKGTRVGILFPNCAQWLICWLAVARIGALLRMPRRQIGQMRADGGASRFGITQAGCRQSIAQILFALMTLARQCQ